MSLFEFLLPEIAEARHLGDIADQMRVRNTARDLQFVTGLETNRELGNVHRRLQSLEQENGILSLILMSLLKSVVENTGVKMKDVLQQLKEVDELDGAKDGRVSVAALRLLFGLEVESPKSEPNQVGAFWICAACSHRVAGKLSTCIYCGSARS